jgi:glycosyltransferase involved in cell wall biosynthesis
MSDSILFSIIIANFNKAPNIRALLASIYDNYPYADFEVFFMDDASTDSSVAEAERFPVRLHAGKAKAGPATLRNLAAREARGEYLLFIDSDAILLPQTLTNFRELCRSRRFGAVCGLEVLPPVVDNWIGTFRTLQIQDCWGKYRAKESRLDAWGATCGAVRADVFHRIGGFKESYKGADVEDHELAVRVRGVDSLLFAPQLTYRHTYSSALKLLMKQFLRASQLVQFERRELSEHSFYDWRFKISHILSAVIVMGLFAGIMDRVWIYFAILALVTKMAIHRHLLTQSLRAKGPAFALYGVVVSLVMSMFVLTGAVYGKLCQAQR